MGLQVKNKSKDDQVKVKTINLAEFIDHTVLKIDASLSEIEQICREAQNFNFKAVCVPPYFVQDARQFLKDSEVKIATVIGFPMGYSVTSAKVEEAKNAIDSGADELDMMMNIAAFKNNRISYVKNDIESVSTIAHLNNRIIKVIIETGYLSREEIQHACEICAEIGVDFVKTSTGMNTDSGAEVEIVGMMRKILPKKIKIKASGGIRTREMAEALVQAGADRLGTSTSISLI